MIFGLASVLTKIPQNLGMGIEHIVVFMLFIGGLILYAKDFKIGVIVNLVMFVGAFIVFYEFDLDYTFPLIAIFMTIIIMSFTLITSAKKSAAGGII